MAELEEVVPAALDGQRVDRVVAMLTGRPRSEIEALVASGAVRVGGRVIAARSRKLRTGERLAVDLPDEAADPATEADPDVAVPVVHADADIIVVDKPAGLVVHPGAGHRRGTMVQGLLAAFPDLAALAAEPGTEQRPGIVHRLDRGTSGLLVVARTPAARHALVEQLAARSVLRRYVALLAGHVEADEGVVDAPLGRSVRDPTRVVVRRDGKAARTRYQVEGRHDRPMAASLVGLRLETGRTHQIRVHAAAIGHPVVGDDRYGGPALEGLGPDRPFLHAAELGFTHPGTGQAVRFSSPLPAELEGPLRAFR